MTQRFTSKAENALRAAERVASELGHTYIGTEHLLYGLSAEHDGVASRILEGAGLDVTKIREKISSFTGVGRPSRVGAADLTPRARSVIELSAKKAKQGAVGTEHLLLSLLSVEGAVALKIIAALGVERKELLADLSPICDITNEAKDNKRKPFKSGALAFLDSFGSDLTKKAEEGRLDPVIGREKEITRLVRVLSRRTKNNPCLVGEAGVGKTAIAEGLALRIAEGNVPEDLLGRHIFSLDVASLVAGAKYRGEFEDRMKQLLEQLRGDDSVILFIDEIHTIVGAGAAEGAIDAANILKPAMARGEIRVIGATTAEEYRRHIERDAALERRFQAITVEEPTPDEAYAILDGLRDRYEKHHGVTITDEALRAAVQLSVRYAPDHRLPDKALDIIDEAASELRLEAIKNANNIKNRKLILEQKISEKETAVLHQDYESASRLRDEITLLLEGIEAEEKALGPGEAQPRALTPELVARTVSERTGVPVGRLTSDEGERLAELESELSRRVIGQPEAVTAVARAVRRSRAGVRDPRRPIGSFLFFGPSGVGKTGLCRALAASVFGSEAALLSFDMSEYMEKHSASRLLGAPPGYIGYEEAGLLTDRVRRHPYAVVLFDEIEKAHPDVHNLLLQILEDGVLTDTHGKTAEFGNTIIVLTSNLGADSFQKKPMLGFADIDLTNGGEPRISREAHEAVVRFFRPELLSRIDETVLFRPLRDEDLRLIAQKMIAEAVERIHGAGFSLTVAPTVADHLVAAASGRGEGARALRKVLTSRFEDRFSYGVIKGELVRGTKYLADLQDNEIVFSPLEEEAPLAKMGSNR